jgi:broad specificity phosphatase PhoE
MSTIKFIRHGEQTCRSLDPEIKLICPSDVKSVNDFKYDIIICSPYLRCRQTSKGINNNDVPVYVNTKLCEYYDIERGYKDHKFDSDTLKYGEVPISETWDQFLDRLKSFILDIESFNCNILVVTHGIVIKNLQEILYGSSEYQRGRYVPYLQGFEWKK